MKQNRFKSTLKVAAALAITGIGAVSATGTASAASTDNNQIEIQLGAIQLGYTTNSAWTNNPTLLANALTQGTQALLATTTNKYTSYVVTGTPTNAPAAQSEAFREQLYQATLAALSAPVTYTNKITPISVTVVNGKTGKTSTVKVTTLGFNPALTTPTKIAALATARVPDLGPGFVSNAVSASVAYTTNSYGVVYPVFGPQPAAASVAKATNAQSVLTLNEKTSKAQLNNASAVAKASLAAAVKVYVAGTKQWAAVPKTGPTNGYTSSSYLPNYSTKAQGPSGNNLAPNLTGLADAAAAVAANAINGLGVDINTNSTNTTAGLYGKTALNVYTISKALTLATIPVQATSTNQTTGKPAYSTGALSAESLGLIAQVSGTNNGVWSGPGSINPGINSTVLTGVATGVLAAVGKTSKNVPAVLSGLAEGFYATYLVTGGTLNATDFFAQMGSGLSAAFTGATYPANHSYTSYVSAALSQVYNAATTGGAVLNNPTTWNYAGYAIPGAKGLNYFGYLNGVGTPVTDTLGL